MTDAPAAPIGEALLVFQFGVIERVISFVCVQHHVAPADADDFASPGKLKILEGDQYCDGRAAPFHSPGM
jgi:hypothetical protein